MGKHTGAMIRNAIWFVVGTVLFTFPHWAVPVMSQYLRATGRESSISIVERVAPITPTTLITQVAGALFIIVAVYLEVQRRRRD
jgi:hypothetical protein